MAEAWTRALRPEITCHSAGVVKHGMNPNAVRVMEEAGITMENHHSKTVDELPDIDFDYVVTLCGHAAENCPYFPSEAKRVHRGFDDPPTLAKSIEGEEEQLAIYRRVRDEIKVLVEGLPANLDD